MHMSGECITFPVGPPWKALKVNKGPHTSRIRKQLVLTYFGSFPLQGSPNLCSAKHLRIPLKQAIFLVCPHRDVWQGTLQFLSLEPSPYTKESVMSINARLGQLFFILDR